MENIKKEIKVLSQQQSTLKNQRKTVHIQGERTMEPWKANFTHSENRSKLRKLYLICGLIKGKELESIDKNAKIYYSISELEKINQQVNEIKSKQNEQIVDNNS